MRSGLIEEIEAEQKSAMDGSHNIGNVRPWYPMKLILLMKEALADKYEFKKEWCYAEGRIFDVVDKTDGQEMTIRLTSKIKDWRDEQTA